MNNLEISTSKTVDNMETRTSEIVALVTNNDVEAGNSKEVEKEGKCVVTYTIKSDLRTTKLKNANIQEEDAAVNYIGSNQEIGLVEIKKNVDSDADNKEEAGSSKSGKRKKPEAKAEDLWKNFDFDDVPNKVTWSLTDMNQETWNWSALINDAETVSESVQEEWKAAFNYLSLQNDSGDEATPKSGSKPVSGSDSKLN